MFSSLLYNKFDEDAESIFRMAYIAEIKEWDNRSHLKRIQAYASQLCRGADLSGKDAHIIALACQLHDIGKSVIPDDLLLRKGNYSDAEWQRMEQHTIEGEQILKGANSPILQVGAIIAATHHERWDGSGYPNGLSGEAIPLGGRICALADVFDALTTTRSYKDTIEDDAALDLIRKSSGTLFDPHLVNIFSDLYKSLIKIKNSPAAQ
jgi:putative two-component system response regulator